jgi:hypothetical protein
VASSARKLTVKTILRIGLAVYGALSIQLSQPIRALAHENAIADALKYCRNFAGMVGLNDDHTILCFDSRIIPGQETTSIRDLTDGGMFVIRSSGGAVKTAIEIADVLREKNALVVIYDYCLSACAGFIFIASAETFIARDTIVAWHAPCSSASMKEYTFAEKEKRCAAMIPPSEFFERRAIDRRKGVEQFVYSPQSLYTKKMVRIAYDGAVNYRDLFWTWNPRYYKNYFKAKITYESYPASQSEVDKITQRLRLPNIVYDP